METSEWFCEEQVSNWIHQTTGNKERKEKVIAGKIVSELNSTCSGMLHFASLFNWIAFCHSVEVDAQGSELFVL